MANSNAFAPSPQLPAPITLLVITSNEDQQGTTAANSDSTARLTIPSISSDITTNNATTRLSLAFTGHVEIQGFQHWIEFSVVDETTGNEILSKKWVADWESGSARNIEETQTCDINSDHAYSISLSASSRGGDNPATTRMEMVITAETTAKPAPPGNLIAE